MPTWAQESFILEASGPASVLKQNESMLRVKTDHFLKARLWQPGQTVGSPRSN